MSSSSTNTKRLIGVDTGGTFTDLVYQDGGSWRVFKLLSSPDNPARAVLDGLREAAPQGGRQIVHGSTVATNAILERKGARTALATNAGFEDVLAIGRQDRKRLYDLTYAKESPLIPDELVFGVSGRIVHTGEELQPLDEKEAREAVRKMMAAGVESVAVSFLFGFANPAHERRMADLLAQAGLPVSLSHEILSEFREYERTSTTAVNAYVSPKMQRYLVFLQDHLQPGDSLRVMQSNGGAISAATAMREPVRTIFSGPAGGVVGALALGRQSGHDRLITFDMGGTSTDVAMVDRGPSLTMDASVSGFPVRTPMLDIHTVGAGGGSIARQDAGGALVVGPESAGADPGPICYDRGGAHITVTDANLYLGRLVPEHFLGGLMPLDARRIRQPFADAARSFGLAPEELAEGILAVANANMERAIRVVSVERGLDPGEFTLLSFGGAGGLHAACLAALLNMPMVLAPRHPGTLSAMGMIMADVIKDYSQTVMLQAEDVQPETLQGLFDPLEQRGHREMLQEGMPAQDLRMERFLDMRYQGQSYEILTPFDPQSCNVEAFHALHERTYGYRNPGRPVEIVTIRLRARAAPDKPVFAPIPQGEERPPRKALLDNRAVIFEGRPMETGIWQREALLAGNVIQGPALVVEYSSTLLVPPFARATVDDFGGLLLEIRPQQPGKQ